MKSTVRAQRWARRCARKAQSGGTHAPNLDRKRKRKTKPTSVSSRTDGQQQSVKFARTTAQAGQEEVQDARDYVTRRATRMSQFKAPLRAASPLLAVGALMRNDFFRAQLASFLEPTIPAEFDKFTNNVLRPDHLHRFRDDLLTKELSKSHNEALLLELETGSNVVNDQPTSYFVNNPDGVTIVYGTSGAGKTRLVLEWLHGHYGVFLVVHNINNGGGTLLASTMRQIQVDTEHETAQLKVAEVIATRVVILDFIVRERKRAGLAAPTPHEWLVCQYTAACEPVFERLHLELQALTAQHDWKAADWMALAKKLWQQAVGSPFVVVVDESQFLLRKPMKPRASGAATAVGTVVRCCKLERCHCVLSGNAYLLDAVTSETAGKGVLRTLHVTHLYSVKEVKTYLRSLGVRITCRILGHQVLPWFANARPRFVAMLAQSLLLSAREAGYTQLQAGWATVRTLIDDISHRMPGCFESAPPYLLRALLHTVFAGRLFTTSESSATALVQQGIMVLCRPAGTQFLCSLREPITIRGCLLGLAIARYQILTPLITTMYTGSSAGTSGVDFRGLICMLIAQQFMLANHEAGYEQHVPIGWVPFVEQLLCGLPPCDTVRLVGLCRPSLVVNPYHELIEAAPFTLPSHSAGPHITFQVEVGRVSAREANEADEAGDEEESSLDHGEVETEIIDVYLRCEFAQDAVPDAAWRSLLRPCMYRSGHGQVFTECKRLHARMMASCRRYVAAVVSYSHVANPPSAKLAHMIDAEPVVLCNWAVGWTLQQLLPPTAWNNLESSHVKATRKT